MGNIIQVHSKQVHILADTVFSESHSNHLIKCLADNPSTDHKKKYSNAGLRPSSIKLTLKRIPHHFGLNKIYICRNYGCQIFCLLSPQSLI